MRRHSVLFLISSTAVIAIIAVYYVTRQTGPQAASDPATTLAVPATSVRPAVPGSPGADDPAQMSLPLHLVAVATGTNVEPRAFISGAACGEAVGYSVGDSPLLGTQLVSIQPTEVTLETAAGLRRLPMSTEKCKVPTLRSSSAPVIDEAERKKMIEEKRALKAELERRVQEGKARRAAMTPAEIAKYEMQGNPECWPDEVPEGKTELDVIPEYCY